MSSPRPSYKTSNCSQQCFRSEIAIVCADIEKQSAAVTILLKVVKKTTCGMKDLMVQMITMSEQIDKLIEENRPLRTQKASASDIAAAAFIDTSAAKAEINGRGRKPRTGRRSSRGILPTSTLMHSERADVETDPAQPQPSASAAATGPALREDETEDGWKKVERKRNGKRKEKSEVGNGKEVSDLSWAIKLGAGASM
jgi:hypothetical protein